MRKQWDLMKDGFLSKELAKVLDKDAYEEMLELFSDLQDAYDRGNRIQLFFCDRLAAAMIKFRIVNTAEAAHMQIAANNNQAQVQKADPAMQAAARAISLLPADEVLEMLMRYQRHQQREMDKISELLQEVSNNKRNGSETNSESPKIPSREVDLSDEQKQKLA